MDGLKAPWISDTTTDAAPLVWPRSWTISGGCGAWAWGDPTDPGGTFDAVLVSREGAEPIEVTILGLFDVIDGLFIVRVTPRISSIYIELIWARLYAAARELGPADVEDVGLLRIEVEASSFVVDALDRHIEIHARES